MIDKAKHLLSRGQKGAKEETKTAVAPSQVTNETIAAHREEVLGSARKYIYPLQASKHRVVKASISVVILAIVTFFIICCFELYKFQSTSGFMYDVTEVVPFPVAFEGTHVVSYNSYLFELRRYMHYYQTQQNVNFSSASGQSQPASLRQRAMSDATQAGSGGR